VLFWQGSLVQRRNPAAGCMWLMMLVIGN